MGTIVTLPVGRKPRAAAARTDDATILLFMGVRYVREFEPALAAEPDRADQDRDGADALPPLEIA